MNRRHVLSQATIRQAVAALCLASGAVSAQSDAAARIATLRAAKTEAERTRAIHAIGQLGAAATPALPDLVRLLRSQRAAERDAATRALIDLAPFAGSQTDALADCLATGDGGLRSAVHLVLLAIGHKDLPSQLADDLTDPSPIVRQSALLRIPELGARAGPVLPAAVRLLGDRRFGHQAVHTIGSLGEHGRPACFSR